jgi:ketosteroid isomerase-like protein
MLKFRKLLRTLFQLAIAAPLAAQATPAALAFLSQHHTNAEDISAIARVLDTYTRAVSSGDEKAFVELLLDEQVPFMATSGLSKAGADAEPVDTHRFAGFRQAVFHGGKKLEQQFYNVHIEQDGPQAQASLDFVTKEAGTQDGSYGWKTVQLLKVNGQWKIASEFFTAYSLPAEPESAVPPQK